ncbi:MAG: hypothetical protein JSW66_09725 [Phycisphaerales bacterium]|nr:MAG: hypothetical protein JSW66_09725 [Phycisphaerales bacterium]
MTTEDLVNKLVQYSTQLYSRQWEKWQLLAAGAAAVVLLMLVVRHRRKTRVHVTELRERSPIIGIRLAKRSRIGIRKFRWKVFVTDGLIALVLLSFLSALSVWILGQEAARLEGPAKHAAASVARRAANLIGVNQRAGAEVESLDREESEIDKRIWPLYVKYKNKYALLPVGGEYVELLCFDPEEEGRLYKHGCADAGPSLPDWGIGEYGAIPPRRILQVLGPDEMLVAGFVSEDGRVVHFKGWPTDGLIDGRPWPYEPGIVDPQQGEKAMEVAVVGTYRYRTLIGAPANIPSVVPLELFRMGVTPDQFKGLLLSNVELPEDLQQLRSDIMAIPAAHSNEALPARTQPKLSDSAAAGRRAGSGFKLPPASS